ncbi:DEAD/DEAH box helicase [bacterium]|jgi:ATP-dependent RNA helicase RhlE|nr:DEAD/DEAH box helicase [bacterium]
MNLNDFKSMDLFAPLQRALAEQNYKQPTPIQAKTIPAAIEGADILGCAQTGTGKTAAFALPILDYLGHEKPNTKPNRPTVLVLAPTRELAIQIGASFRTYGKHMKFRQALVYGGVGQGKQVNELKRGVHVLIATPGRLQDLMDQGHVSLDNIEIFVLDEADRMLDMGFLPALKKIIAKVPQQKQSLFFSATMPPKIRDLASRLLFNPISITVAAKTPTVERIEQSVRYAKRGNKFATLTEILNGTDVDRTIVFTRTKHGANGLAKKLDREGIAATAIHGNKTQNARQRALEAFRQKKVTVLVATDVAARGIDIDGITHVINFDMPVDPESYVHRIGRTGRAGSDGIAISFCTQDELDELRAIEKLIGTRIRVENPEMKFDAKQEPDKVKGKGNPRKANRSRRRKSNNSELRNGAQTTYRRRKKSQQSGKPGKKQRTAAN